jgi:beta-phosphoglucomutase-like phosphatase (HAD superfamily)
VDTVTSPISRQLPAAVLWDMDGTLVDTEPYWIHGEHALVEAYGGVWTEEYAHELVGNDLMVSAEFIRANSPVTLSPVEIVEELLEQVIRQVREHVPWRPGARELLFGLVEAVVEALPPGTFTVLITGDEVEHGKPHPEPYLAAARALGVDLADCVAIEDSPTGVRSAVDAGVPTLAVPHVVPVPRMAGSVQVPSLRGLEPSDLLPVFVGA